MLRVGQGFDLHRLVSGRRFMLGGVQIESPVGPEGHSDGDVLFHALTDALLGAAGLGDIGDHFPPSDPAFKDADSAELLVNILGKIRSAGWQIENVDSTVFLEKPKLGAYKPKIRERLAGLLDLSTEQVSVKAKTMEGLGAIGSGDAVAASVSLLLKNLG